MVKGMETADTGSCNMGNGQTTTGMVDKDSSQHASKQDGRRKHGVHLEGLDSISVDSAQKGVNVLDEAISSTKVCSLENGEQSDEIELVDHRSNSLDDYENEKIAKHFGHNFAFSSESLKELLLLHLDLMEQQQYKLMEKDRIITQLRAEKDQLESRLTRMERRMAVQRKHTGEEISDDLSGSLNKSKQSATQIRGQACITPTHPIAKRPRFSHSSMTVNSRQVRDQGLGTYIQTESTYLHDNAFKIVSEKDEVEELKDSEIIIVPNFRITPESKSHSRSPGKKHEKIADDMLESLDDDTFYRRHQKLELDERRRKRWDIQHTRHQRQQETLKFRQKEREVNRRSKGLKKVEEGENKGIKSLMPDPEKLIAIEVSTQIPVSAFGSRIPAVQQSEFNLPWFDIAKKEVQLRQMKERREKREKDRQRKRSKRKNTRRW